MSTLKLYPLAYTSAPYEPPTKRGNWDNSSATLIKAMSTATGAAGIDQTFQNLDAYGSTRRILLGRFTYVLPATIYFTGTVGGVLGIYSNVVGLGRLQLHLFVLQGETDTLRGTLWSNYEDPDAMSNSSATSGEGFSDTMADVIGHAGDTLVLEVGYRGAYASAARGSLYYGAPGVAELTDNGNGASYHGWLQLDYTPPTNPNPPTLTSPAGGETWREGEVRNVTYTPHSPEQAQGWPCDYELQFSAAGTFADAVTIASAVTGGTYAWTLPLTLVAADTATCKVRVRTRIASSPTYLSAWVTSGAFTVRQTTPPTITLVAPVDAGITEGPYPTLVFGTADPDAGDHLHIQVEVSTFADLRAPLTVDTNSVTDYASWEESPSPFSTWTTVPSGGATPGNRLRYVVPDAMRFDRFWGRARLWDGYAYGTWLYFSFIVVESTTLPLSVAVGGIPYRVSDKGPCVITEETGGTTSTITCTIPLSDWRAAPITRGALFTATTGLGPTVRTWNAKFERPKFVAEGTAVELLALQDDQYLSGKLVTGDLASADIGQQIIAIIAAYGSPLDSGFVDPATGVSAAVVGDYKTIAEVITDFITALPDYLFWVDPTGDLHFIDQADMPDSAYSIEEADPSSYPSVVTGIPLLPGCAVEMDTLPSANRVYVYVQGTAYLTVATNTTASPTYAESPREKPVILKTGNQATCDAVAPLALAAAMAERVKVTGLAVDLDAGLGIVRGVKVPTVVPRAGVDGSYPVQRISHDFGAFTTTVELGQYQSPKTDQEAIVALAQLLQKLQKEAS